MFYKLTKLLLALPLFFAHAAFAQSCTSNSGGYCVNLAATAYAQGVPGLEFLKPTSDIGELISNIYVFGMGLVAISALVVLVAAGVRYMSAGDNAGRAGEAKKWMGNAIFGLVLALLSWLILYTINPAFLQKADWVKDLKQIGDVPGIENIDMRSMSKSEFSQVKFDTNLQKEAQQSIINDPNITSVVVPTDKETEQMVDITNQSQAEQQQSTSKAFASCKSTDNAAVLDLDTKVYQCAQWGPAQIQQNCAGKPSGFTFNLDARTTVRCP